MMKLEEIELLYNCQPTPSIILKTDSPHFSIAAVNHAFLQSTHTERPNLIGKGFFDAFPINPDDQGARTEQILAAFEHALLFKELHRIPHHRYDLPSANAENLDTHYWRIETYPLIDETGEVQYIVQSSIDITLQHTIEKKLEEHIVFLKDAEERATLALQRNFDLFNFSPVPILAYDTNTLRILAANHATQKDYGYTLEELLSLTVEVFWPKGDEYIMQEHIDSKVKARLPNNATVRHITKYGKIITVDISARPLPSWGQNTRIIMASDITEKLASIAASKVSSDMEHLEKDVLELNSKKDVPIDEVLNYYAKGIEALFPQMQCSIMQVKNNRLYNWASPSLPEPYQLAIEGLVIGENTGSCGTSAFLKRPVIVSDITNDPIWSDFHEVTLASNLRACWSHPIINSDGQVMATFGMYYQEVKSPTDTEFKIIERAAALLKVILENRQYAEMMKENTQLMAQGQELAQFGNWSWDIQNNIVSWSDALFAIYGLNRLNFKATFEGYQELLHSEDRAMVYNTIQNVLKTKQDIEFEERIIRPNGEVRYLKSWGMLKCDTWGNPVKMIGACLDITDTKKSQEALLALNQSYSDLFHLSPQPMWVYELDSLNFVDVNNAAIAHYGYSREEFLSKSIKDIRPAADVDILNEIIQEKIKQGISHSGIIRHVKKSGEIILVTIRGNSITYNGKDARVVIAIDNTDKINAEEALILSERRFKTLIQDGSDLIVIMDIDGNYQYVSPNSERVLGVGSAYLNGKNAFDFVHRDDRNRVIRKFTRLNSQKRIELSPFRFIDENNKIRWVEMVVTDMRDDPTIAGIIANARNVTQRVENEIKIKEHLERYNTVSKATSDAIWDANVLTGDVIWNQGIKGIFGYKEVHQRYEWWRDHVHPDDRQQIFDIIETNIRQKESRWTCEYRFLCADGNYKFVLDRGFLIFNESGQPIRMIGAMQDITERINYIHDIEQHNLRLREIRWAQAHLVRAPLARIMGIVELLNDPGTDNTTLQTLLSYLNVSAQELDEAIKEIIKKSKT